MSRTDYIIKRLREIKRIHIMADGMMWEGEPDICVAAADALEEYQRNIPTPRPSQEKLT